MAKKSGGKKKGLPPALAAYQFKKGGGKAGKGATVKGASKSATNARKGK